MPCADLRGVASDLECAVGSLVSAVDAAEITRGAFEMRGGAHEGIEHALQGEFLPSEGLRIPHLGTS